MQNLETLARISNCQPWIISKYGEDVFQETCVRYLERIRKAPQWHAGYGAIKKIALSVFIDTKRKQSTVANWLEKKRDDNNALHHPNKEDCLPEARHSGDERRRVLDAAIEQIRPEYALVITKRFFDGQTIQEIADESGIAKNTIRSWRTRGLKQLKSVLQTSNYFSNN